MSAIQADARGRGSVGRAVKNYLSVQAVPLLVLLVILIIASLASPVFLTRVNLENLVLQIAVNMIVSMGMFLVILTGGIDLSVGSVVAVSGVLMAGLMETMNLGVAMLLSVLAGAAFGLLNGWLVSVVKVAPFIVTLGMMSFARGVAYWYTKALTIICSSFPNAETFLKMGGGRAFGVIPIPAVFWILFVVLTAFLVKYTTLGRVTYAIGGNEEAARLSGIKTRLYKIFPYLFTGFCAGFAGVLLTSRLGVGSPASGLGLELDCVAATVIGGTSLSGGEGTVSGVVIGVFVLGIINNILDLMNVPSYPQQMLKGAIIVAAVILSSKRSKKG